MKKDSKFHIIYILIIGVMLFFLLNRDDSKTTKYENKIDSLNLVIESYYDSLNILDRRLDTVNKKLVLDGIKIDSLMNVKKDQTTYEKAKIDIINLDNDGKLEFLRERIR